MGCYGLYESVEECSVLHRTKNPTKLHSPLPTIHKTLQSKMSFSKTSISNTVKISGPNLGAEPWGTLEVLERILYSIRSRRGSRWRCWRSRVIWHMRISFLGKDLGVLQLTVNDTYLENVRVHKVLGITLCDNLSKEIVDKACKWLYLLRVLKLAGVPPGSPY